jgi:GNAT superfamily N-acetyltransferase
VVPGTGGDAEALVGVGRPVETDRENGAISVLLGHVIASKTDSKVATDASMDYPRDWKDEHPAPSELGHLEEGRTIVLHSVAMAPQVQGRGLGRVLLLAYMQHMNGAGIADRLVLIAHDVSDTSISLTRTFWYSNITGSTWCRGTRGWGLWIKARAIAHLEVVDGMTW